MSKFKLIRECPACHKKLYLGDILKPAFQSTGKEIVCPKCGNHFRAVAQILMAAVCWSWAWPSNPGMGTIIDHIGSVSSSYV